VHSEFTISLVTEQDAAVLLRVVSTLGRHRLEISSFTTIAIGDSGGGMYRHTAAVIGEADRVRRAMKQLGSALGVLEARYCRGGETIDRELGLYTLSMDLAAGGAALKDTVTRNGARVVVAGADYIVIEKTGSREEVEDLFKSLEPFGVMEFVRSGQTTVTKPVAEAMVHETTNIAKASSSDAHGGKY
jgi:acetolactate synthase-1/3 small subunit